MMLPAHETKHLPVLSIPFPPSGTTFQLAQHPSSESNGTCLWTGGQVLALYVAAELPTSSQPSSSKSAALADQEPPKRRKVVELGSGTGFTALALATLGWSVLATDVDFLASGLLEQNIARNLAYPKPEWGDVHIRALDWTQEVEMMRLQEWELQPPYDLIVTADTLYSPELVTPLLRTLHHLASSSIPPGKRASCPILVCLERRDPAVIDRALKEAREEWEFGVRRVPHGKVVRAVEKGGLGREGVEGLEIWRLELRRKRETDEDDERG